MSYGRDRVRTDDCECCYSGCDCGCVNECPVHASGAPATPPPPQTWCGVLPPPREITDEAARKIVEESRKQRLEFEELIRRTEVPRCRQN